MPASAPSTPAVGWVRHNFLPPSETFIHNALRSVVDAGVKVRVLAINRREESKFPYDDVTVLNPGGAAGWTETARYWTRGRSGKQWEWAQTVGLIHGHMGYTSVHSLRVCRALKIPLVTSFYGRDVTLARSTTRFSPGYVPYTLLRRRLFEEGDRFHVLSKHMRDELAAQGCPTHKIKVVHIGVDLDAFPWVDRAERRENAGRADSRSPTGKVNVLMVGREVEKKGFDDGLDACARACALGASLRVTILGTGASMAAGLRTKGDALGLEVDWRDPKDRTAAMMREADILLVPSRTASNGDQEGTPTVICEGSAMGLPIVSTLHAGIPDQVEDGETGFLSPERDIEALAQSIVRLAESPSLRDRFGRAGREKIVQEFGVRAHRDALIDTYGELGVSQERAS